MTMRELHEIVLDLSNNGGGTYWHSPECPWRRAREYVEKEKNDAM
jgi:hypothetical protein